MLNKETGNNRNHKFLKKRFKLKKKPAYICHQYLNLKLLLKILI